MSPLRVRLLSIAVFVLAWTQSSAITPRQESGFLPIDPPTPYIRYLSSTQPAGRILVIHGLNASKETSQVISAALADGGFEVYAIDLPGHGDSNRGFQTALAQQAIHNARAYLGEMTTIVAHSMGAGLVLDLAATEQFSTIVLLAPPPISVSKIHADRVLIVTGELDVPRIRSFVDIAADVGPPQTEAWLMPWGGHSAPIFDPTYIRRIVDWLGGNGSKTRTASRLVWIVIMFISAMTVGVAILAGGHVEPSSTSSTTILARYVIACGIALFTMAVVNPVHWLRLFAADYLIGFLLLSGLVLTGAAVPEARARFYPAARAFAGLHVALLSAAFVITVPGLLVVSHVLHLSLPVDRLWRFPIITLAGLPLFLADELFIRRLSSRWKSVALGLLTRVILVMFMLTGVLTLNRENAFLLMILPLIVIFWIALWLSAGVVHRYTRNPVAAAIFAAIVQGWAFAALLVTI